MHDGYPWDLLRTHWDGVVNVAVSEFRRQELSDLLGVSKESIRVITNGVDLNSSLELRQTIQLLEQLRLFQRPIVPALLLTPRRT
jgi:hypothetical protein